MSMVAGETKSERVVRFLAFLFTLGFFYLYVENIDRRSEAFSDAQLAGLIAFGVFVSVFILCFMSCFLWLIPWEKWLEQSDKINSMVEQLRPRLALDSIGPQSLVKNELCRITPTMAGGRFYALTELHKGIVLPVKNPGNFTLKSCQAFLVNFREVGGSDEHTWEALPLPWIPLDGENARVDIPSMSSRSIWLMRVVNNRLNFMTSQMPLPMVEALKDRAEYHGLIVLTADGIPASHYPFTLLCGAPENPPSLTLTKLDTPE